MTSQRLLVLVFAAVMVMTSGCLVLVEAQGRVALNLERMGKQLAAIAAWEREISKSFGTAPYRWKNF